MLNDQLVTLEKYKPVINFISETPEHIPRGWHSSITFNPIRTYYNIHVYGANSPQIAINVLLELFKNKKTGSFKINELGNPERIDI